MTGPDHLLERKLETLPDGPGVYLWKDEDGQVLYVGKAKRLRTRVRSYWAQEHDASPKTRGLLRKVQALDTIVVPSEAHALMESAGHTGKILLTLKRKRILSLRPWFSEAARKLVEFAGLTIISSLTIVRFIW